MNDSVLWRALFSRSVIETVCVFLGGVSIYEWMLIYSLKSTSTLFVWMIKSLIQRNRTYVNATGCWMCASLPRACFVSLPRKHWARRQCVSSTDLCCCFTSHVMHFAVFLFIKQRCARCCRLCLVTATPPPAPGSALVEKGQLFFFLRAQPRWNASGGFVHICILDCDSLLDCGVENLVCPGSFQTQISREV